MSGNGNDIVIIKEEHVAPEANTQPENKKRKKDSGGESSKPAAQVR